MAEESFVGEISIVAFDFAPRGWLPCDGRLLAISDYMVLYSIIGNTYGGDGRTTFRLPNLAGRMPLGQGAVLRSPNEVEEFILGEQDGQKSINLTIDNLPAHDHGFTLEANNPIPLATHDIGNTLDPTDAVWANTEDASGNILKNFYKPPTATTPTYEQMSHLKKPSIITGHTNVTGLGSTVSIMNPYLVLNFIICVEGIYPSRPIN